MLYARIVRAAFALASLLAAAPAFAQPTPTPATRNMVALVTEVQELGPFSPDEMARRADGGVDKRFVAADAALNDWKKCLFAALDHWAPLRQGAGTLADAAFGRCAEFARAYRIQLLALSQDGRAVMDPQMARAMTRSLEDIWRPRLVAAALDQELAVLHPAVEGLRP